MLGFGALGEFALGEGRLGTFDITGTMFAIETKDVFYTLGGSLTWPQVVAAEIGILDNPDFGAEVGVTQPKAVGAITRVAISIRIM